MIVLNRRTKIFVCKEPTDMRASYDSLFARVKSVLQKDPFSGHLFLFINARRTTCKCLVQLPSKRYPNAPLIERDIVFPEPPDYRCCNEKLKDSGMTEDSEYLTVIPKEYIVIREKKHKYRCDKCHGDIQTPPSPPRIKAGSAYSDDMMLDVAMTKYCDLIPIQRYVAIAERSGVPDLPQQSLIETTHYVAEFCIGRAMSYLLGNFAELTAFTRNAAIPIDNNPQERLLRNPVVGRKTWYGTHSKRTGPSVELTPSRQHPLFSQLCSHFLLEALTLNYL